MLAVALLTVPVMGAPATKIPGVTMAAMVTQVPNEGFPHVVSHGTIMHSKGTSSGTVKLIIPTLYPGPDGLDGIYAGEWNSNAKVGETEAETELQIMGQMVWTFTGAGTTGTFEGVIHRTITGFTFGPTPGPIPGTVFEDRMVLHGTGDFQGLTLKLSYEGPPGGPATGYAIIPK